MFQKVTASREQLPGAILEAKNSIKCVQIWLYFSILLSSLEHRKKAIFAAASEVMKALAPFLALDITVQLHIYE
ncbi:hypothetical protein PS6_005917 [Mucor atramentarius]